MGLEAKKIIKICLLMPPSAASKRARQLSQCPHYFPLAEIRSPEEPSEGPVVVTEDRLTYFRNPRSKRLAKDSLLDVALSEGNMVVRDLEMALPPTGEGRSCRCRKKARL